MSKEKEKPTIVKCPGCGARVVWTSLFCGWCPICKGCSLTNRDYRPSVFYCAECKHRLVEVRKKPTDWVHNLRCLRCDREFMEQEEKDEELDPEDS